MVRSISGARLIALAALIGLGVAAYDYVAPLTGLTGTAGLEIVAASLALMLGAALVWMRSRLPCWLSWFLIVSIFLDIAGTGLAAWLLESPLLLGAMALALIGWLLQLNRNRGVRT